MLAEVPLILIGLGLVAYAVLAGADFGAGAWTLLARGPHGDEQREQAHHSIGPVWEANHVWLVFVLVVAWTAYPVAFASIASTLIVPLGLAAIGIIIRGAAYALRSTAGHALGGTAEAAVFGVSSVLTPFALGAAAGAIASGRVPVGNARGELIGSWTTPTSTAIGVLFVVVGAYLAAVYLTADAARRGAPELEADFRRRALASGVVAGAAAAVALLVLRSDAPQLYHGLTSGAGVAAVAVSAAAGIATLALVRRGADELARLAAAVAVAAVVAGWALAQRPDLLPGLTVQEAAAPDSVLWALIVATVLGAAMLGPSLAYLFGLVLRGEFDEAAEGGERIRPVRPAATGRRIAVSRAAPLLLPLGIVGLIASEAAGPQAVAVLVLLAGAVATVHLLAADS
jgi:cytochrome bd ubiquinol oxidase subunit II